jgi:hypothetical protein
MPVKKWKLLSLALIGLKRSSFSAIVVRRQIVSFGRGILFLRAVRKSGQEKLFPLSAELALYALDIEVSEVNRPEHQEEANPPEHNRGARADTCLKEQASDENHGDSNDEDYRCEGAALAATGG